MMDAKDASIRFVNVLWVLAFIREFSTPSLEKVSWKNALGDGPAFWIFKDSRIRVKQ